MESTHSILNVGVIGAGWPGEQHAEAYLACERVRLLAIADLDVARRTTFSSRYGCERSYADYQDLVADPDIHAVSIALPNFLHAPATIAALEAGKHVLCEKPPATMLAEARAMAAAALRSERLLAYALQRRFNAPTEVLRTRLIERTLGEIYHARAVWTRVWGIAQGIDGWFTDPARSGGGALIDIGIHVLDLAWFLMDCPKPVTVSGQVFNRFPALTKADDSAFALIRFADGRSLQVETSWVLAQEREHMAIHLYGTEGGAKLGEHTLELFSMGAEGRVCSSPALGESQPFALQIHNFVRAIHGEEPLRTPADQGVQLMQMIESIYRSSAQGRELHLS